MNSTLRFLLPFLFWAAQQMACVGQPGNAVPADIIGCWRTERYTAGHEVTIFPAEVRMEYQFHCDGSYAMLISNGDEAKRKSGTFVWAGNTLTLTDEGGAAPVRDTVAFLDGGTLEWLVELDGEQGVFLLKRVICKE